MNNRPRRCSLDDQLEALGRLERRRLLLGLLAADSNGAAIEFDGIEREAGELDPLVTMRHLHLPLLEERGFIRWDRGTHEVTPGPQFGEIEPLLELLQEVQDDLPGEWL